MARIQTTHAGSLPRPPELADLILRYDRGELDDLSHLQRAVEAAIREVVRKQVAIGIDIVSDGEYSKASYVTYVKERLRGFDGPPRNPMGRRVEPDEFPDYERSGPAPIQFPTGNGPVSLRDPAAVRHDVATFQAAAATVGASGLFMTAASPGVIDTFMPSTYYASEQEYLTALGDVMFDEYRAIVDAGITLQVDCPDLAMSRNTRFAALSDSAFIDTARMHLDLLASVLGKLPTEQLRLHLCWGNFEGPHNHDVPLADIIDMVLAMPVGAISFEAANPRHAHEWRVFTTRSVPSGMKLIPGVIDTCTNFIEHPELVAERLQHFVDAVGADRVIAGTDCGFGTAVGMRRVAASIAWAKLEAMVEGARLASGGGFQ
ncbi:MAG: cobalamin-independent methionine synthase II family protein [Chloroflexi bacterium]|nr:cobalamin-independent methionine synthase II family protein [Chloroflexota bacterium]